MDHSPGELEGEIDHLSRDAAVEYLLMPERVKKLEGQVEAVASNVEELNQLLKKTVKPQHRISISRCPTNKKG
jgi:formyltetrahydrofolate hydrolase